MTLSTLPRSRPAAARPVAEESTLVACPDARPPAYEAAAGLARAGMLGAFRTGVYYRGYGPLTAAVRNFFPCRLKSFRRIALRRHHPQIPGDRVISDARFDLALAAETRLAADRPSARRAVARWRTEQFDRRLARDLDRLRPGSALVFSDVGSEHALPACRRLGIASVLSMVHGDVREEATVLDREAERSPDFFPIYLGDGRLDRDELAWLHARRLRDIEQADLILVPSAHIAETLVRHGTPRDRVRVVPYAADTRRFAPSVSKRHESDSCTFLFAGGVTQRKGVKYLLEAWRRIRRPGWRLQLLGALPADPAPLSPYRGEFEHLGRVGHAEMPAKMAAADVFAFPSLFEGSAVVTYEALACGLPCVVTPEAGSVVRDGVEGLVVPPADVDRLAEALERLGTDPGLRAAMSASARARAEQFDWPRYHRDVISAIAEATAGRRRGPARATADDR